MWVSQALAIITICIHSSTALRGPFTPNQRCRSTRFPQGFGSHSPGGINSGRASVYMQRRQQGGSKSAGTGRNQKGKNAKAGGASSSSRFSSANPSDLLSSMPAYRPTRKAAAVSTHTSGNLTGRDLQSWDFVRIDVDKARKITATDRNPKVNAGGHAKRGGGRGRGAKRLMTYASLNRYSDYFTDLVSIELQKEKDQIQERLNEWPITRLCGSGFALMGMVAFHRGRLFNDFVLRFSLPPLRGERRRGVPSQAGSNTRRSGGNASIKRPPLPFHRFTEGDIICVTAGVRPPNPSLESCDGDTTEGVVVTRTPHFLDVCVKRLPDALHTTTQEDGASARSGERFRLDQIVNGVSYDRQFQAVRSTTSPDPGLLCPTMRDLLMECLGISLDYSLEDPLLSGPVQAMGGTNEVIGNVAARAAETVKLGYSTHDIDAILKKKAEAKVLNDMQLVAVKQALTSRLTLIQGPPGTGKTLTSAHIIATAVELRQTKSTDIGSVLATAFSNVAADNLLEGCLSLGLKCVRVGRPGAVRESLWHTTLASLVESHPEVLAAKAHVNRRNSGAVTGEGSTYEEMEKARQSASNAILREADVVVSSCIGAGTDKLISAQQDCARTGLEGIRFRTVLVDEATQSTEPSSLVPMALGCEQLILVGDQCQLPPTILSREAQEGGLGTPLFTRLIGVGVVPVLLTVQYRMHPALASFPSSRFYSGRIKSYPKPQDRLPPKGFPWPSAAMPVSFIRVSADGRGGYEKRGSDVEDNGRGTSWCNMREAVVAVAAVRLLLGGGDIQPQDIGIISPYSAQVRLLGDALSTGLENKGGTAAADLIEKRSVDGYQGREKEVIILSAVRSNTRGSVGFLSDWRRLNVALTRARRGVIVIGDPATLSNDPHWSAYIRWCIEAGVMVDLASMGGGGMVKQT